MLLIRPRSRSLLLCGKASSIPARCQNVLAFVLVAAAGISAHFRCAHSCICRLCPRSRSLLLCGEFHLLAAAKTGGIFCPALLSEEFRRRFPALLAREILPRSASSRSAAPEAADICTQENGAPFRVQGKVLHFPQTLHVMARKVMQMHSMRAITV